VRILIADDEAMSQRLLQSTLERAGYEVIAVENGRQAADQLCTADGPRLWGEPLSWHSFFGHSFRFHKSVLASPSRRRGLGKGTAFESPSPVVP